LVRDATDWIPPEVQLAAQAEFDDLSNDAPFVDLPGGEFPYECELPELFTKYWLPECGIAGQTTCATNGDCAQEEFCSSVTHCCQPDVK
jgi:hypothetical protein